MNLHLRLLVVRILFRLLLHGCNVSTPSWKQPEGGRTHFRPRVRSFSLWVFGSELLCFEQNIMIVGGEQLFLQTLNQRLDCSLQRPACHDLLLLAPSSNRSHSLSKHHQLGREQVLRRGAHGDISHSNHNKFRHTPRRTVCGLQALFLKYP